MSAYVVDQAHIRYLVRAALTVGYEHSPMAWVWNIDREAGTYDRATLPRGDCRRAQEVGQMLRDENIASVQHRYPDTPPTELPGVIGFEPDFQPAALPGGGFGPPCNPVQVLKACACYRYQSCEHPGWHESEAQAFVRELEAQAIAALPGYDEARWEITDEQEAA